MLISIRSETPQDAAAVRNVNEQAFGQAQEARLVEQLHANGAVLLSLVAIVDDQVVGHILYSPACVGEESVEIRGAGLAPLAVLPQFQRCGVGSELVDEGSRRMRQSGYPFIVVLGHPEYYPRFGFVPASRYGLRCQWDVPDEAFMVLALDEPALRTVTGLVRYRKEFRELA